MRWWAILLLASCRFDHGAVPPVDAKSDAAGDAKPADARKCAAPPAGCQAFTCGGSPSCYFVCGNATMKSMYSTAASACQAAGGCVVVLDNQAESDCVAGTVMPTLSLGAWIGFKQSSTGTEPTGGWAWECGGTSAYRNWQPGEPDDLAPPPGEDCAAMADLGQWIDVTCNSTARYVCEIP